MRWLRLLDRKRFIRATAIAAERAFISLVQPVSSAPVGIARDVVRSRTESAAENAFLRQQLIVLLAAQLLDRVFPPKVPVRQWVLSVPWELRTRA